jgi:hypothetical protein
MKRRSILLAALAALAALAGAADAMTRAQRVGVVMHKKAIVVASYTPASVHLDGQQSYLSTPNPYTASPTPMKVSSTTVADTSTMTVSYWLKAFPASSSSAGTGITYLSGYGSDIVSSSPNSTDASTEVIPGNAMTYDNASSNYGTLRANFNDDTGGSGHQCLATISSLLSDANWHHILYSFDGTVSSTTKSLAIYVDGVSKITTCTGPSTAAFVVGLSQRAWMVKGNSVGLFSPGAGNIDVADVFLDATISIVCDSSSNITVNSVSYACPGGQGTIPAALLAKFYKSGPVYLGANGAVPLGRQPEIYLSGSASGFQTNLGQVTNLTTAGSAWNAPTGPNSMPTAHPYVQWATGANGAGGLTTLSAYAVNPSSTIAVGDLLITTLKLTDTMGVSNHSPAPPSGFTLLDDQENGSCTNSGDAMATAYRLATSADVSGTGQYTWTWTTAAGKGSTVMIVDVRNANQTTPIDAHGISAIQGCSANTASDVAPSVSPSATNDLLLSVYGNYGKETTWTTITQPSGQTPAVSLTGVTQFSSIGLTGFYAGQVVAWENLTASGATGTRTATLNATDAGVAANIAIAHP